jgi:phosphomevalonate kinase
MRDGETDIRHRASAPGKVILSGEYAVLDGAPAILMAVDRRARVVIEASGEDWHTVAAMGNDRARGRFTAGGGEFAWLAGRDEFRLVESVWRTANADADRHLALSLDTRDFVDAGSGVKLGIGSSAALAAALSVALAEAARIDADPARVAYAAHRHFQAGLGSGADVACSLTGGLVDYTMGGQAQRISWPEGLEMGLLWSGVPADTGARLEHLAAKESRPSRAALALAARRFAEAWRRGAARDVLDECRDYTGVLREFSVDHGLGIFDAGHGRLADSARGSSLACKPCGAGGGDVAVVLATARDELAEFMARAAASGFRPLAAGIDSRGVEVSKETM